MHSAGVLISLAAGKARKPMTSAPSMLPDANWKPHMFISTYLVMWPIAAIDAHRGNTFGDGLLMLEKPMVAVAAKILLLFLTAQKYNATCDSGWIIIPLFR